ncbi:THO complex subunit 3 [Gracilaria domingensis]|nr:THO complex subunit 3 [Gracilaria domingensis]
MSVFHDLESKRCFGHRSSVTAVAWNLDGSRLLAAGDASTVLVYDTQSLAMSTRPERNFLHECHGHTKNIEAMVPSQTSPDMFVTGGVDCLINVYDTRTGSRAIHSVPTDSKCLFADWAPDGNTVAIGLSSNMIYFVDCLSWTVRKKMPFDVEVNQFRWTPDGRRIMFTRGDGSVDAFSWPSLDHIITIQGHVDACFGVACDPKGRFVAIASLDTCVSIWDSMSLSNVFTIDRWEKAVQLVDYSYEGQYLAMTGDMEKIDITDASTGSLVHSISTVAVLNGFAWHPSRLLLAYAPVKLGGRDRYGTEQPATYVWGFPRTK